MPAQGIMDRLLLRANQIVEKVSGEQDGTTLLSDLSPWECAYVCMWVHELLSIDHNTQIRWMRQVAARF